jgi:toxin-antitoxin system PIN domain toxin
MILPDINLLVYAFNDGSAEHDQAKHWWEDLMNGTTPVALPWVVSSGFIRLVTHPRVLNNPIPVPQAVNIVRGWLQQPVSLVIEPGKRFPDLFFNYLQNLGAAGNLTTDAQLAALAVEHQAILHSNDVDFTRFDGLRWHNPIQT